MRTPVLLLLLSCLLLASGRAARLSGGVGRSVIALTASAATAAAKTAASSSSSSSSSKRSRSSSSSSQDASTSTRSSSSKIVCAVMPGDPVISGTFSLGVMNGISLFTYILYARFALSWFPQLPKQFPVLRPINTVTEPYLRIFRQVIPPIGGFDISALPAIFLLDIFSQTVAAIGDSRTTAKVEVWSNKKQRALEKRVAIMKQERQAKEQKAPFGVGWLKTRF